MILLDKTILVYAVGAEHPLREPCRAVVEAIGSGRLGATATVETIQEFAHVRARRRGRADAARLAGQFARLLAPLTTVDPDDLRAGLALFAASDRLGCFDAVLAAVARHRPHMTGLASADRAFTGIDDLVHHNPASGTFRAELGI